MRVLTCDDVRINGKGMIVSSPTWSYHRAGPDTPLMIRTAEAWDPLERDLASDCWQEFQWLFCVAPRHLKRCLVCGSEFYGLGRVLTCTEVCAAARRRSTHVHSKAPRLRIEHEPRPCHHCGHEFTPTRADARFCSGRCRTAHHRGGYAP
jgi:hypothetical protein